MLLLIKQVGNILSNLCGWLSQRNAKTWTAKGWNVIHGLLGRGVAETARVDPQAKGLGEHLRARLAPIPAELLPPEGTSLA